MVVSGMTISLELKKLHSVNHYRNIIGDIGNQQFLDD
jgi:hypothetical protein